MTAAAKVAIGVDKVVIATTTEDQDNAIQAWGDAYNIPVFRGSEKDVLARFTGAAEAFGATAAIRLTGDCPFIDPSVISQVVRLYKDTGCDYCSNVDPRTWPDGLDTELISIRALRYANLHATRPIDRECVSTFIARNRSRFPDESIICPIPKLQEERWVLDTPEDFEFCSKIANRLNG